MLTIAELQVFDAVARYHHFTRAAEELGIAQPSVTYHVRELERHLGVQLVELVGRRIRLTDAGERLAVRVAAILSDLHDLDEEMLEYQIGARGQLRLGATRTVGGYALAPALLQFYRRFPKASFSLQIDNTVAIERLLLERQLDLALVEWEVISPDLLVEPLRQDALLLVCSPEHHLAHQAGVDITELSGQAFVMRERGSGTRALAEKALAPVLHSLRIVLEIAEPEAIVRAVQAGIGLSFLSETIVRHHLQEGTLVAIPLSHVDLVRNFSLVRVADRRASTVVAAFIEIVRKTLRNNRHAAKTPEGISNGKRVL